eukprot:scaffold261_cov170-Amphora_coffeaeformis.AAC.8
MNKPPIGNKIHGHIIDSTQGFTSALRAWQTRENTERASSPSAIRSMVKTRENTEKGITNEQARRFSQQGKRERTQKRHDE